MAVSTHNTTSTLPRSIGWMWIAPGLLFVAVPLLLMATEHAGLRLGGLLLVGWALPGLLLARCWRLPRQSWPALLLAAWGLGAGWLMLGALLAHYLPGPLVEWRLWGIYMLGGLALTFFAPAHGQRASVPSQIWMAGGGLLLLTVLLRLPGLGYHEFHTDEVVLLRQAVRSIEGQWTALAEHTKGPGELAIALAVYRALGTVDEAAARLPFALMGVGSVLATAWLGMRMFRGSVGVWAALLLLCNGFALGLSRIAQYQPAILLLSVLAVWAMWEFAQRGEPRWLSLAAVYSVVGLVFHYEIGLLAPALVVLAIMGWRATSTRASVWRTATLCALLGALLLAVAYVPPLFNPYFATTQSYLTNRLGETMVFNVPFFVEMGTFYNSSYFFFGLIGLAAAGTWLGLKERMPAALILTVWWLPFFILYIFVVRFPGTHFYQMMTAWALLAALPLARLSDAILQPGGKRLLYWVGTAGVAAWLFVSVFYLHLLFFRQNPEYLVNYDRERLALYWAPYPVPQKPRFGFPIYEGWKALGVLGEWGYLQGSYMSNDRSWALRTWYLAPFEWVSSPDAGPDYVFTALHIQEENIDYHSGYHASYHRIGEVRFRNEPRIELWAKEPLPVPYVTFDAELFDALFEDRFARLNPAAMPGLEFGDGRLDEALELAAANLADTRVQSGETIHLTLVWQAHATLAIDYKLFVHLADAGGRPVAQWDGYPGLNTSRTSTWRVDAPFTDHVLLAVPPDTPPGEYTLLVGLYDPESGARLGERAISITSITVK